MESADKKSQSARVLRDSQASVVAPSCDGFGPAGVWKYAVSVSSTSREVMSSYPRVRGWSDGRPTQRSGLACVRTGLATGGSEHPYCARAVFSPQDFEEPKGSGCAPGRKEKT